MIELKNVSFSYNEAENGGIDEINLQVRKGEFLLLCGCSGCGKTTITRCINGLVPHFYEGSLKGSILLKGQDITKMKLHEISETVGSVFQDPRSQFFTTDTVSEVAFTCENAGMPQEKLRLCVDQAIKELGIEPLRGKSLFELSSGERQRVAIASVYAFSPEVYVFDEPSANLDAWATEELAQTLAFLKKKGATIIISEHRLSYLKDVIDRVAYMENGRIKKEYEREEFLALSDQDRSGLGLRTLCQETVSLGEMKPPGEDRILQAEHVWFGYKRKEPLLQDLSFTASRGDIIGVIGHNGAGKSTFAQMLCGLLKEQKGTMSWNSRKQTCRQRVPSSYFIMQDADYQLFSESVADELLLGNEKNPDITEKMEEVLSLLHLEELRERHPFSLSGGQKQRTVIAAAYMRELNLVVFDEPTSGLDADNMKRVSTLIRKMAEKGLAVFVITHDYELLVGTCQRILHLDHGSIQGDYRLSQNTLPKLKEFFRVKGH